MHRNSSSDDDEGDTPELPSVYSFGQNAFGELALGDTIDRNKPTRIDCCSINDQSSVTDVACGNELTALLFGTSASVRDLVYLHENADKCYCVCALESRLVAMFAESGDVFTCGYNDSGQCAVGSTDRVPALQLSPGLSSLGTSRLFSGNGSEHLAALSANGQLYTVGFNANGQLGIGSAKNVEEPTLVGELVSKRVVVAACSYFHTTVVTDSGELYACGCNEYGQLGSSDSDGQLVPRSVGYFSRHPVLAVACGQHFTVASLKEGGVVAFGKNDHGQLGIGRTSEPVFHPTRLASPLDKAMVPQISCGYHHTAVITEDGAVYTFGRNDYGQLGLGHKLHMARPTVVESLSRVRVVQVACGCYHTLVLSDAGKVFPFGRNNHGQLGLETSMDCLSPQLISSLQNKVVVKIAAGFYHSVCLVKTSEGAKSLGKGTETLSADLSKMLNNPTRSDVVFVVEDRRFFAHGCILAARCEPLEKMLDGRTKDGLQPAIVIPEYSFDVFAALMEFLYTDQVAALAARDLTAEFALELHGLADQYLVANLRSLCENALLRILSVENVVIVMESAHFRSAFTLKKRCARFIVDHYNRICATEAFAGLPQALLDEVLLLASHQGVAKSNQADDGSK